MIFKKYDKDGDGNIIHKELSVMLKELGRETTQEELQDMINEMDIDGNGSIQLEEFMKVMEKKLIQQYSVDEIEEAFRYLEKDNDKITKEGLKLIFSELGEELTPDEIDDMFKAVCKDNRDYVTSSELS